MLDRLTAIRSFGAKAAIGAVLASSLLVAACGATSSTPTATCPQTTGLTGAGSTLDAPLFSQMFTNYANTGCKIQVNYQAIGSGAGINQLLAQTVDFGATDSPMTSDQLTQSKSGPILHIPITIGAPAIAYNLPSLPASAHLKFTGAVLANIYLGKITFWDDPALTAINAGVTLPHQAITVEHRSDGSGTTSIFTHYLSAVSPDWSSKVGAATTVAWPVGVGGKGNAGVAANVKSTAGSIGYIELAYVLTNTIQYGAVQNQNGDFALPSLESAKTAAGQFTNIPADLRFFIVNAPGAGSYPITGYSWVIVYQNQTDTDKGKAIAQTLWWMTHNGQQLSTALSYVPLPSAIVAKDEAQIKAMKCGSAACYQG